MLSGLWKWKGNKDEEKIGNNNFVSERAKIVKY